MEADDASDGVEAVREAVAPVARRTGCRLVVLHGSRARGEPARDVDLAVLPGPGSSLVDLTNRLIRALGTQDVDLSDLSRSDPLLMALVARDGVPLYEREPGTHARFCSLAARRFADTRKFRRFEAREIRDFVAARRGAS